jgi:hypothetical protein
MESFLILLFLLLVPANGLALWAFLRFAPRSETPLKRRAFNVLTFAVAPLLCAVFSLWLSTELTPHMDRRWMPALSAMGWITAFPVLLVGAMFLRYYLVLRHDDEAPDMPSASA